MLLGRKEVEPKNMAEREVFLVCLVAELKKKGGGVGKVGNRNRKKEREKGKRSEHIE